MKKQQEYDEDDGHTIADMSYVGKRPMLGAMFVRIAPREERRPAQEEEDTPQEPLVLTKKEQRFAVLGAMKAGMLVGCIYIAGLVGVILLLLFLWHIL